MKTYARTGIAQILPYGCGWASWGRGLLLPVSASKRVGGEAVSQTSNDTTSVAIRCDFDSMAREKQMCVCRRVLVPHHIGNHDTCISPIVDRRAAVLGFHVVSGRDVVWGPITNG